MVERVVHCGRGKEPTTSVGMGIVCFGNGGDVSVEGWKGAWKGIDVKHTWSTDCHRYILLSCGQK